MAYDPAVAEQARKIAWFEDAEFKDGAWRWKSNGQIPFEDMLYAWGVASLISTEQIEQSIAQRKIESAAFLEAYTKAQAERTPEQIAEDRAEALAAFGPGETIVNVATGERYTT